MVKKSRNKSEKTGPITKSDSNKTPATPEESADGLTAFMGAASKPLESVAGGMKDAQGRHSDSFDKGTDFYTEALRQAETAEEREKVRKDHADHQEKGHQTAEKNNRAWVELGKFAVVIVAIVASGTKLAAQVLAKAR